VFLEVDSAPYNGWQEQRKQRAPIAKDNYEHDGRSCDAHRVDADFPPQIDEVEEKRARKIAKHDCSRGQGRVNDEQDRGADKIRNSR